jgi:hypothetical protein
MDILKNNWKYLAIVGIVVIGGLVAFNYLGYQPGSASSELIIPEVVDRSSDAFGRGLVKIQRVSDSIGKKDLSDSLAEVNKVLELERMEKAKKDYKGGTLGMVFDTPSEVVVDKADKAITEEKPKEKVKEKQMSPYREVVKVREPISIPVQQPVVSETSPTTKKSRSYGAASSSTNMGQDEQSLPALSKNEVSAKAILHNDQKVYPGGPLFFRLTSEMKLDNGLVVPVNTFVTGTTIFEQQRCQVTLTSVKVKGMAYAVNLIAFDAKDGVEGLYIPGGTGQEAAKGVASDAASTVATAAAQKIGLGVLSGSLSRAGQGKVNDQSVLFPAGYEVIFKKKL